MIAPTLIPVLALDAQNQRAIFIYMGLIVAAAVLLVIVALIVRRLLLGGEETGEAFSLSDIRAMHARGELSDDEFDAARRKMVAQHRTMLEGAPAQEKSTDRPDKETGGDAPAGA